MVSQRVQSRAQTPLSEDERRNNNKEMEQTDPYIDPILTIKNLLRVKTKAKPRGALNKKRTAREAALKTLLAANPRGLNTKKRIRKDTKRKSSRRTDPGKGDVMEGDTRRRDTKGRTYKGTP